VTPIGDRGSGRSVSPVTGADRDLFQRWRPRLALARLPLAATAAPTPATSAITMGRLKLCMLGCPPLRPSGYAQDWTRTSTRLLPLAPQASASTNSATCALRACLCWFWGSRWYASKPLLASLSGLGSCCRASSLPPSWLRSSVTAFSTYQREPQSQQKIAKN
jgi:hypothetical protein